MGSRDIHGADSLISEQWFDASYYTKYGGRRYQRDDEWLALFDRIAVRIASDIQPQTVLDVGCALGLLVETLRNRGVDAFGIDISPFAIGQVYEPFRPFCSQGSAIDSFQRRFDLIVSIEVLEHMAPADAEAAVANFCSHTDDVLFSSSPFDFAESTHVNVRPPEYWAGEFARHGFFRDVDFDASFVSPWAVRFRKRSDPASRLALDYERLLSRLVIERTELRGKVLSLQQQVSELSMQPTAAASLAVIEDRLAHIQRSWFWRARKPWAWISRLLGRAN